ncbi:helix-hairpin-helix domain-containing protein [Halostella sp. JP-L12]|uniref:DUF7409 domain-containing protein n=1 Tax=Halostella TaxID=1843185 RepID=UPI000EF80BBC|nr:MULTISPECIES: helix-hairpin-helix domain-containing protein [Halostella]NHN49935.1 helix-hairpin-helix domain-containing protein [Halostella sp. JP-L12]
MTEHENPADEADTDDLTDLQFIGDATASVLEEMGVTATDVRRKTVSYRQLVDAGVNPGVATKIRREHSLSWNLDGGGKDLDNRSNTVRGLRDGERSWVAASQSDWQDDGDDSPVRDGDWTPTSGEGSEADGEAADEADGTPVRNGDWSPSATDDDGAVTAEADGSGTAAAAESAWRDRSRPDPVTDLDCVDEADAELLADAGVTSVRRLATSDPYHVADVLLIDEERVVEWRDAAADRIAD